MMKTKILDRIIIIFQASHPFSSIMSTSVAGILMIRLGHSNLDILVVIGLIFLVQIFTGLLNDYLDIDEDRKYKPTKPTIRKNIDVQILKPPLLVIGTLIIISTIVFLPILGDLILITGVLLAQSYNFGLKDTPFSALIFVSSFGLMALLPFVLLDSFNYQDPPLNFFATGVIIAFILHISNKLIDFNSDRKRGINNFVVYLGRTKTNLFLLLLLIIFVFIQYGHFFIIFLEGLALLSIHYTAEKSNYKTRELGYFLAVIFNTLIVVIVPIN